MTLFCCRSWRTELCKGSCALVCISVDHDESQRTGAVRGVVLESQYLLEPCGTARTRLTHVSRVDLRCGQILSCTGAFGPHCQSKLYIVCSSYCRGRSPEWYNKAFGHLCVSEAQTIRNSFHLLDQTSLETKTWTPGVGLYFGLCFQSIWDWLQVTPDGGHTCNWRLGVFPGCWAILERHSIESFSHRGIHLFNDQFSKTSSCIRINVSCFLQLISFRNINYWKKVSTKGGFNLSWN